MPLPKIDFNTLDFTGVKEEDLTSNDNFRTMEIGEKRKFVKALTDFNNFDSSTTSAFNAIVEADHIGFNSSGASRTRHFGEAEAIRNALRETETLKAAGEFTETKRSEINKNLVAEMKGLINVQNNAANNQSELREAALGFERANKGAFENSKLGGDKKQLEEAQAEVTRFNEIFERNGIKPTEKKGGIEDITSRGKVIKNESRGFFDKASFLTDEFRAIKADAESFTAFGGEPVFKDHFGEFSVRPHAVLLDPDGIADTINNSDAPSITKQDLLQQADRIKKTTPVNFLKDISGFGQDREEISQRISTKFNKELKNKNLPESSVPTSDIISNFISDKESGRQVGLVKSFNDGELAILDKIVLGEVSDFTKKETDKPRLQRLAETALRGVISGTENIATLPVSAANLASSEGSGVNKVTGDILDAVNAKRQSQANLDQLSQNNGVDFQLATAITQEIPSVIVTRGLGGLAGGGKTGTRVATAFGTSREALSSVEELRKEGKDKGQQLRAGLLTGITSFVTTQAFNKLGAGGVENFDDATKTGLKSDISKILKDTLGEGSEEFIQTLTQSAILNSERHWNDTQSFADSLDEAIIAFFVGGIMGGVPSAANVISDKRVVSTTDKSTEDLKEIADVLLDKNNNAIVNNNLEDTSDVSNISDRKLQTDELETTIPNEEPTTTADRGNDRDSITDEIAETDTEEVSTETTTEPRSDTQTVEPDIQPETQTIEETDSLPTNVAETTPTEEVSVSNIAENDTQDDLSIADDTQADTDQVPESSGRETPAASTTEVAQDESSGSQEPSTTSSPDNLNDTKTQLAKEIIDIANRGDLTNDEAINFGKRLENVDSVEDVAKIRQAIESLTTDPTPETDIQSSNTDLSPAEQRFKDRVINNVTASGSNAKKAVTSSSLFSTNPAREIEITNDAIIESLGAEQAGQIIGQIQNVKSESGVTLNDQIDIVVGKRKDKGLIDKAEIQDLVQSRLLKSIHNKIKNGQTIDDAIDFTVINGGKTRDNIINNAIRAVRNTQEKSKEADQLNRNSSNVEPSRKARSTSQISGVKIKDGSASKQRKFIDSGALSHATSQLPSGATVKVVDVDDVALNKVVNSVTKLFGANVVFFQASDTKNDVDDGFTIAGDNNVYVNVDSSRSITQIIGHEAAHVLQTENTDTFNALIDNLFKSGVINKTSDNYLNFLKRRGYKTDIYDQQFFKEYTADLIGRIFEDATHLDQVRSDVNNDNVFKRFVNALAVFTNKLRLKLRDLVSGLLPDANGKMFSSLNDSLAAVYILNETLSQSSAVKGVPDHSSEAHKNTYRLVTLQNQVEGFVNPVAQSFVDLTSDDVDLDVVNSSKSVKGKKNKKTINEGKGSADDFKKFVAEANPLKDTAVSVINKIAEERGWTSVDNPQGRIESIVRNFGGSSARNTKNVRELISRIKEDYTGDYDLNESIDGDVIAAVGIKLAMIDNLKDVTDTNRKEELFSAIAKSDVTFSRGERITSLNEQIRLSAQVLSVLGNLGADAEGSGYRYFAGLAEGATTGLKKNNIDALGQKDHEKIVDTLNDERDTNRILALMEENARMSDSLSSAIGALKRQRESNKKLVDRLIIQIEKFRGAVSSSAKTNAENQLDAVLEKLHEVSAINDKSDVNDIETLIDDGIKSSDIIDSIDFDFLTNNPKFKKSAEAVRDANEESKQTREQANEDTDGEFEENDADYFLSGKLKGFKKSIKNAIKSRDVSEHQRIYGQVASKFKVGELSLQDATTEIINTEEFEEADIDKVIETLQSDLKTTELLSKEQSLQTGKRKIYDAQIRQIKARKDKPKAPKNFSPADTLKKLNNGSLTVDKAVTEIRDNIEGVVDEHVEAYLSEGLKTSNKRAKSQLQSKVDRHIGESLHGSTLKLARSLGVSSFDSQRIGLEPWSKLTDLQKSKSIIDSDLIPKSARTKANADRIVEQLNILDKESSLDNESSVDVLESLNTIIKESKTPPSASLNNWLKTKIEEDPTFWHELPSKKLEVIRGYFEEGRNDNAIAGVFTELINDEISDTGLDRLAEISVKRLQKAAKQLADQKATALKEQLDSNRFSVNQLSEAINMGLLDRTVSRDAIVSEILGDDFKLSGKAIEEIAANRAVIESMIKDGVAQPYSTDVGGKALENIDRVLTRELKDFNNNISDTITAAHTASILASTSTVIALPALGAFSLGSSIVKQFLQIASGNKNNPNFSRTDRLKLLKENFIEAFNLPDIGASAVNGLLHGSHASGDVNLSEKQNSTINKRISILDARLQKLEFSRNKLATMKTENVKLDAARLKQYSVVMGELILTLKAATTSIFNVMQGITEVFAEPARKLNISMEAQENILQGNLTLNQFRSLREQASNKAKASLSVIERVSPDIPWYSKRVQVNQMLNHEVFQSMVQDFGVEDAMNAMHSAHLTAVGLSGDTNESIGPIGTISRDLSNFLGKPLKREDKNILGYASKGARFTAGLFFKFFNSASHSLDAAVYYTPLGVGMTLAVNKSWINSENNTGIRKRLAESIENYNSTGRARKERYQESLIGAPAIIAFVLQSFMVEEEDDQLFWLDLSYPEKTKDQVAFMEEVDRREYKLYINTEQGRIGLDMGRGAAPQLIAPLVIAQRIKNAINKSEEGSVVGAVASEGKNLTFDMINLGSPFVDGLITEVQRQGVGDSSRLNRVVNKTIAQVIDFTPSGFANDVDKIRFGKRSTLEDAPFASFLPTMQLFNQFSEYKGEFLDQRGEPVVAEGFWDRMSALNFPISFSKDETIELTGDKKKAADLRNRAHYGLGQRSDFKTWSKGFFGKNTPLAVKNAYAEKLGYRDVQEMHETAIMTRAMMADKATVKIVNGVEINQHIDDIKNPVGNTSQARVASVNKSEKAASKILSKKYGDATSAINGKKPFRDHTGKIRKGFNKSSVTKFIEEYQPK